METGVAPYVSRLQDPNAQAGRTPGNPKTPKLENSASKSYKPSSKADESDPEPSQNAEPKHTLAYDLVGNYDTIEVRSNSVPAATQLLRGDVALTVNIPKGSDTATLQETINNFQQWNADGNYWDDYIEGLSVALNTANIGASGTFSGTTQATPGDDFQRNGCTAGAGVYKGSFYGPRDNARDLEVAGSWTIGNNDSRNNYNLLRRIYGSFGAKQRPAASSSN